MEGVVFTEEGCDWKDRKVIVWYFDVALAADENISEDHIHSAYVTSRNSIDPLERSSVAEIRAYIMASKRGGHPAGV